MRALIFTLLFTLLFGTLTSSAFNAYDTYTYSIDGEPLKSPAAYSANQQVDSSTIKLPSGDRIQRAVDIVTDAKGNIYITDAGSKPARIIVLDQQYKVKNIVTQYVDENNEVQTFNEPSGVFVTKYKIREDDKTYIYVCDKNNYRIVVFEEDFTYVRTINAPETTLLEKEKFMPDAVAVDQYGRIFVVANSCNKGVIVLSSEGDFTGFIGAQKVTYSILQIIWRNFQTKEQLAQQINEVPAIYNNITVDEDGFVYVTSGDIDKKQQIAAIKSKNADYSPIKKLNSAGDEIMKRNGFFDPGGEVAVNSLTGNPSVIVDVAVGPEGTWSLLEGTNKAATQKRSRIFTYDQNGNLLFAFGDRGDQLGNGDYIGFTYQTLEDVTRILVLNYSSDGDYAITVFEPTEYCDTIMNALHNQNTHNYSDSIRFWEEVLKRNNNFDLAYIGIGKALFNQGKYEEAQEMLANAYETDYYSRAFSEIRKEVIGKWLLPLLILVIALFVLIIKFLAWAKKKNKATSLKVGRKTYGEELLYIFHLMLHPFDGFWDLKHEQRGSVRAATTILGVTILAFFYQSIGRGYSFNPRGQYSTIFVQIISVLVPVLLWCLGNWCLTTLFDGEGSFKDIYVASCYSLAPLPFMLVISTILTNVLTASEGSIATLLVTIAYVWVAFLLFFGMLVTHDYSMGKNLLITICTIVAMVVIMFVAVLFSSLLIKMVTFVIAIFNEIGNRV